MKDKSFKYGFVPWMQRCIQLYYIQIGTTPAFGGCTAVERHGHNNAKINVYRL